MPDLKQIESHQSMVTISDETKKQKLGQEKTNLIKEFQVDIKKLKQIKGEGRMSIKKQYLKSKPVCKVTFRLPKESNNGAKAINLVGEFNSWNPNVTPMKPCKNGSFFTTVDLDVNKEYQFRYLMNGVDWENDLEADSYIHCSYGNCENSVVIT